MKLNALVKYKKPTKRLGRGIGSGLGKTSGRGHKGQGARSGKKLRPGFEGGQTPYFQKLPKYRGFKNVNQVEYQVINVGDLDQIGAKKITKELLLEKKILRRKTMPVKVLGNGEVSSAITVELDAASQSAIDKITAAGGSFTSTMTPSEAAPKKKAKAEKTAPEKAESEADES